MSNGGVSAHARAGSGWCAIVGVGARIYIASRARAQAGAYVQQAKLLVGATGRGRRGVRRCARAADDSPFVYFRFGDCQCSWIGSGPKEEEGTREGGRKRNHTQTTQHSACRRRGQSGAFTNTSAILRRPPPAVTRDLIRVNVASMNSIAELRGSALTHRD